MIEIDKNKITVESYNNNSKYYADKFDSYSVRTTDIDRAIRLNESGENRVLELGCGNGKDAQYIISSLRNNNFLGIDASAGLISLARKKVPRGTFIVDDIRNIDFSPETFGIIFSFAFLLHLKHEEVADLIYKSYKWLKIGGILYVSTKYGEYREIEIENLGDKKYYYAYTPKNIIKMMGAGFEVIYNVIQDSDYGPSFTVALRKI